jgi:hypothetical protein
VAYLLEKGEVVSVLICSFGNTTLALAVVNDKSDFRSAISLAPSGVRTRKMGIHYEEWKVDGKIGISRLTGLVSPHSAHLSFGVLLPLFPRIVIKHTLVRSARYGV